VPKLPGTPMFFCGQRCLVVPVVALRRLQLLVACVFGAARQKHLRRPQ
jgi:hypothetical protein